MRRMEKEYNKKFFLYKKELEEIGLLDIEQAEDTKPWARDEIAKYFSLEFDTEILCTMGMIDITMYYNGVFGVAKEAIDFFINDLHSLQDVMKFFYGTPFSLNFKRIDRLAFVRYAVTIPEVKTNNFRMFIQYINQLNICLHNIHTYCNYDC